MAYDNFDRLVEKQMAAKRWIDTQRADEIARKVIGEANRRAEYAKANAYADQWDQYRRGMVSSPLGDRLRAIMECEDKSHPFHHQTDDTFGHCLCGELKYLKDGTVLENFRDAVLRKRDERNKRSMRDVVYDDGTQTYEPIEPRSALDKETMLRAKASLAQSKLDERNDVL